MQCALLQRRTSADARNNVKAELKTWHVKLLLLARSTVYSQLA